MRTPLCLLALLVSLAPSAAAQNREAMKKKILQMYDRDGDKQLSPAERAVLIRHLLARSRGQPVSDERPTRLADATKLYKATAGPLGWKTATTTLPANGPGTRALPVRATWPERGEGPFPIIVWSHGAHGSGDGYLPLSRHWASHGYVVFQPTHADSAKLTGKRVGSTKTFDNWAQRPLEVRAILDRQAELRRLLPALEGRVDGTRVGVGGHSFGAGTTLLVGGARPTVDRGRLADPRPRCLLIVSGQGQGGIYDASSFAGLTRPALVITGTQDDSSRTGKPWTWRTEPYTLAPATGGKHLLVITGAYHNFGGIAGLPPLTPGAGPLDGDHVRIVLAAATALFDAHLKGDATARSWLASRQLIEATGKDGVRYETKGLTETSATDAERALKEALEK